MTPPQTHGTGHLPCLYSLKFSGKVEDYPEFKHNWLARFGKLENYLKILYLKPPLAAKLQAKVYAVLSMDECWAKPGIVFGSKRGILVNVK